MKLQLTILIPAYNEEELLPECLSALLLQTRNRPAEIIVIDNNSSDGTTARAEALGVRVVHEPNQGYVFALLRGFTEARGEIVATIDADTIPDPEWIESILSAFQDASVVASTGPIRFVGANLLTAIRRLFPHDLWGANMALRKSVYEAVGGFDPAVNLAADIVIGKKMERLGKIHFSSRQSVATSSRRFQVSPIRESIRYMLNALSLSVRHRPLWWDFPPIRANIKDIRRFTRKRKMVASIISIAVVTSYFSLWPSSSVFGRILIHAETKQKLVALTFDDGPNGMATRAIVDTLKANNVPATFFEVGRSIAKDPATTQYVAKNGFPIENHSWSHSFRLPVDGTGSLERELDRTSAIIYQETGKEPTLFRPPHGFRSPFMLTVASRERLHLINWSVNPMDYMTNDASLITDRVLSHVHPGSIVLLHDGLQDGPMAGKLQSRTGTIEALPVIINHLRNEGYTFVTVPDLLSRAQETN